MEGTKPPMTSRVTHLVEQLEAIFGMVLKEDLYDVVPEPDGEADVVELMMDDWTLHLADWPEGLAFLAIDEEPDNAAGRALLLERTFYPRLLEAFSRFDAESAGALVGNLRATNDPISVEFAEMVQATGRKSEESGVG